MLKFRLLTSGDFALMLEWLSREHVRQWWDDGDDTLEKVISHYGQEEMNLKRFVLIESGAYGEKPIGYFQHYLLPGGSIGIDQFIGEETHINRGVGTQAIEMFIEMIVKEHSPPFIILDPLPDNKRAIRCYEKAGFRHYETVNTEEGNLAYMMRFAVPAKA